MKKIGLVTVTYVDNFGSHLQSFALQEVIRSLGYETEIISPKGINRDINKRRIKYLLSRWYDFLEMKSYLVPIKKKLALKLDKEFGRKLHERSLKMKEFADAAYSISPIAKSWDELSELCAERYSSVVVGSDQNWRPANIAGGYYTIEYVPDDVNKVAYSTSFGISHIIPSQKEKAKHFLRRIDHLSVREDSGQKIIKELLGRDVPVVCDPVILIRKEEWQKFIIERSQNDLREVTKEPFILCYFLGESKEHREFANELRKKTGLKIISVLFGEARYFQENPDYYDISLYDIGPLDFVNLISKAHYICTDSFHGSAFSLVFQKQFYAFYKSSQGEKMSVNSRLDSMLGWAGVAHRIIKAKTEITETLLTPINYTDVIKRINEKRQMSMEFLTKALK